MGGKEQPCTICPVDLYGIMCRGTPAGKDLYGRKSSCSRGLTAEGYGMLYGLKIREQEILGRFVFNLLLAL